MKKMLLFMAFMTCAASAQTGSYNYPPPQPLSPTPSTAELDYQMEQIRNAAQGNYDWGQHNTGAYLDVRGIEAPQPQQPQQPAIQGDILGGYREEMAAEAAAKNQNARAYSVDASDPQAVYRLMTSTMSTTEIVIAFVIWFAIRLVIIVVFYYLARGIRRLRRAPFEKPAAVVLSILLAVPGVLSFLFIAMIPAELSQYKDGFWLLFSWIVFFYFSYKYWRAICNALINDYLESDEEGERISTAVANSAQSITNAAKNLELGDKLAQLFRQKMVLYIALAALLIVALGATYYYLSPYHTCVRTMMSENTKDPRYSYQNYSKRDAIIFCSRNR